MKKYGENKKSWKNALSLVLTASLLATVTACGSGESGNTDDTKPQGGGAEETTLSAEDALYASLPTADYDGMVINVLGYGTSVGANDGETLIAEQTGDVVDDAIYNRNAMTEERLGIKLNFITGETDANTIKKFISGVLAGDDSYDMMTMKTYALGNILSNGVLMPWDDIEGVNYDKPWYVKDANETLTVGNKTFALCSDVCGTNITMCWSFILNKTLAEKWQIEDLYQVVRDGDWTMDKLMSVTKDVWEDVNGNTKPDLGDVFGVFTDKWATLDSFMLSHDIRALSKDENDYPVLDFYSDTLVESFEKVYQLYWENPGTYVDTTAAYEYVNNFANGEGLLSPMYISQLISGTMREMKDEYGVLPYPKLNDQQEDYCTYVLPRFGGMMLPITLSSEKQEMIGELAEVWSAYSHKLLTPAIYDVSLNTKGTRDEESVEMLELIMEKRTYCFSSALQQGGSFPLTNDRTYRNMLGAKNKDITSKYKTSESAAVTYIENLVTTLSDVLE